MNFHNRICQMLHDEHLANVALMQRIGQLLAAQGRAPPDNNQTVQRLLSDLGSGMASEVKHHFDFEESALFPYLVSISEGDVGVHLSEEHSVLRPLVAQLCEAAHAMGGTRVRYRIMESIQAAWSRTVRTDVCPHSEGRDGTVAVD
jgi:hemerythrin-like domain-containing protein